MAEVNGDSAHVSIQNVMQVNMKTGKVLASQ